MMVQMTTLREARRTGNIDKFIAEHERDKPGDLDKLDAVLMRPVEGTATADREASRTEPHGD